MDSQFEANLQPKELREGTVQGFPPRSISQQWKDCGFWRQGKGRIVERQLFDAQSCCSVTWPQGSVCSSSQGNNVVIEVENNLPKVTKDGVTIVKSIDRIDALEELSCALLRKAAHNTNEYCGDGTTTSTILAGTIFQKGQRMLVTGSNPVRMKRGMEKARDLVIDFLEEIRRPADTLEILRKCALVSTNYDEKLSDVIAESLKAKGHKGIIHMEPVPLRETSLVLIQGGSISRGMRSKDLIRSKKNNM